MRRLFSFLRRTKNARCIQEQNLEELRSEFRRRYSHFRTLLTANNIALQAMADLEKAYHGNDSYRMSYIRSRVLAVLINVYKMITNIQEMSGGKYKNLEPIFEKISSAINTKLEYHEDISQGPFSVSLTDVKKTDSMQVGSKMANIGEASSLPGINVPYGFVMTTTASRYFLSECNITDYEKRLETVADGDLDTLFEVCTQIGAEIKDSHLPADLEEALGSNYRDLEARIGCGCKIAMRSSAIGEDSAGTSFAGQYRTILNVEEKSLLESYKEIIAGKYAPTAVSYRFQRGFRSEDVQMSVGCQVMVEGRVSGVLYTSDPESGQTDIVINAVLGGAKKVVDGTCIPERYILSRVEPSTVEAGKTIVAPECSEVLLSMHHLSLLREAALRIEEHFGQPQDIEWSLNDDGRLYILQCRPLMIHRGTPTELCRKTISDSAKDLFLPLAVGGVCASPGVAAGTVLIVKNSTDMNHFPKGAVLLVEYPLPEWAPLLGRVSAVISENGSEAGHLATVAREFGIPALFSVQDAMKVFGNGDTITVNASQKAIYSGICDDMLYQNEKPGLMEKSPVQSVLGDVLQVITPLNMLDTESMHFRPSSCETLHDITRYCHEKSVSEMFTFGGQEKLTRIAAKRLVVGKVPQEWWVIDLADGVRQDVFESCKTVRLEDIVSIPMLAVVAGISALRWEGPPAVNVKGFGSIIMQSVMRPDLDPAVNSKLTGKNYFLISRNFCNLSVRLGYHYAMIEAFVGEQLMENYVTFRFKGGAADLKRRTTRAKLLAEVLEHYDFQVELRSDSIVARIKRKPLSYLEERLKILGYMILHARQIDMVMNRSQSVEQYREKFHGDIDAILSNEKVDLDHDER